MVPLSPSQHASHHYSPKVTTTPASRSVRATCDSAKPYQNPRRPPRCSKILEPFLARATPGSEATPSSLTVAPPTVIGAAITQLELRLVDGLLFWFSEFGLLCFCSCGWAWWLCRVLRKEIMALTMMMETILVLCFLFCRVEDVSDKATSTIMSAEGINNIWKTRWMMLN